MFLVPATHVIPTVPACQLPHNKSHLLEGLHTAANGAMRSGSIRGREADEGAEGEARGVGTKNEHGGQSVRNWVKVGVMFGQVVVSGHALGPPVSPVSPPSSRLALPMGASPTVLYSLTHSQRELRFR